MKPDSNRLVALDAMAIFLVSLGICLFDHNLIFMSAFVPTVYIGRLIGTALLAKKEGVNIKAEVLFLILCTLLGGFNDWNSVCNKEIYSYTVPHFFKWSTVPLWMLLFWGLILRFMARICRWQALNPPDKTSNRIGHRAWNFENPKLKILIEILILIASRQAIYRLFNDPVFSWLTFVAALFVYFFIFQVTKHDLKILALSLLAGPLVEIFYIQIGRLHSYPLDVLAGLPFWLVLWWGLAILIWKDLSFRIENSFKRLFS